MSYEIIYKVGSFKTEKGYIPFVVIGSNNTFETHYNKERREKNVDFFSILFKRDVNNKKIFYDDLSEITEDMIYDAYNEDVEKGNLQSSYKTRKGLIRAINKNIIEYDDFKLSFGHLYYCAEDINEKFTEYVNENDLDKTNLDLNYYVNYFNTFLNTLSKEDKQKVLNYFGISEVNTQTIKEIIKISVNGYDLIEFIQKQNRRPRVDINNKVYLAKKNNKPAYTRSKDLFQLNGNEGGKELYINEEQKYNDMKNKLINKNVVVFTNSNYYIGKFKKTSNNNIELFKYRSSKYFYILSFSDVKEVYVL